MCARVVRCFVFGWLLFVCVQLVIKVPDDVRARIVLDSLRRRRQAWIRGICYLHAKTKNSKKRCEHAGCEVINPAFNVPDEHGQPGRFCAEVRE